MRSFADHNPIAVAVYFLCTAGIAMFCMDPVILALSLAGALVCFQLHALPGSGRSHLYTLALFLLMALINPLVSHRGATVLFVINHTLITLEATVYGIAAAGMIVSVLYWFRAFSSIMTSDKLLYLFGGLSPKLALILSMTLRYVPLFGLQARKVSQAQKVLGLYKEDNVVDSLRGGTRIFSVMVTWALENGIITADSMTARGYGVGRRSRFSLFRWRRGDTLLLLLSIILAALTLPGVSSRAFAYYPLITAAPMNAQAVVSYLAYALLAFLPAIIHGKEAIRWHFLTSGI